MDKGRAEGEAAEGEAAGQTEGRERSGCIPFPHLYHTRRPRHTAPLPSPPSSLSLSIHHCARTLSPAPSANTCAPAGPGGGGRGAPGASAVTSSTTAACAGGSLRGRTFLLQQCPARRLPRALRALWTGKGRHSVFCVTAAAGKSRGWQAQAQALGPFCLHPNFFPPSSCRTLCSFHSHTVRPSAPGLAVCGGAPLSRPGCMRIRCRAHLYSAHQQNTSTMGAEGRQLLKKLTVSPPAPHSSQPS